MSCYFRHLTDILAESGIVVDKENKKDVDRMIHEYLGVEYKNCSDAWRAFKASVRDDDAARKKFIAHLKKYRPRD
ncbi:MAG TPA: hypothetical protein PLG31_12600 [Spirochaetota bacterium]|nr:hypothetical protein [Spirochaetota bacterium]